MRRCLILCLFAFAALAYSQEPSQPAAPASNGEDTPAPNTGDAPAPTTAEAPASIAANTPASIAGTVVRDPDNQPLRKVLIQIVSTDQKQENNYSVTTDADGHFSLENVKPGQYHVYAEKTGFQEIDRRKHKTDGEVFSVTPGQQLQDVVFHLQATAVISGRVVDEDGEAVAQATVFIRRKKPGKGLKLETAGSERTNDLGEFRSFGLAPGQYLVVVMPPPDVRDLTREKPPEDAAKPDTRYLTTYYPAATDASQASFIALHPGDDIPVNVMLSPVHTYRVRGVLTGIQPGQKPTVEIVSKAGDVLLRASEVTADGRFEVRGVAPGSYAIRASAGGESQVVTARQEINVIAGDVDGLKLAPMPSFAVTGHLTLEGRPQADAAQYTVNLRGAEVGDDPGFFISQEFFGENTKVDRQGNFQWNNINPGSYIVQLYGGDAKSAYLTSIKVGNTRPDAEFSLSGATAIELVASTKAATLEGIVLDQDHQPVPNATVVAVPDEKYRKVPSRYVVETSDQKGWFAMKGLAPGTYTLYAWMDLENDLYYDSDFLASQSGNATPMKFDEGTDQHVELKLSDVGEDWR
jgi:protocatechuate 3,4-dioxygenase beta subunit